MAYLNQDEDQNNYQNPTTTGGSSAGLSPTGGVGGQAQGGKGGSGQYSNLNDYLRSNMATSGKIGEGIRNSADQSTQGIQGELGNVGSQINYKTNSTERKYGNDVITKEEAPDFNQTVYSGVGGAEGTQTGYRPYTEYAEKIATNKPTDTQAYQAANQKYGQLQNRTKDFETETGRNNIIANIYKNRGAGVNALDQSIYQGTGNAQRDQKYFQNKSNQASQSLGNAANNYVNRKIDVNGTGNEAFTRKKWYENPNAGSNSMQ